MKIGLGTDHAGFEFKEELKKYIEGMSHEVTDYGTCDKESCDYPDFALKVGQAVAAGEVETGVLVCGAGHGMAIAANKVPGVRAATCYDDYSARMAREHNDSNVLVLPARVVAQALGQEITRRFLNTPWEGGRHGRRLEKIKEIEKHYSK